MEDIQGLTQVLCYSVSCYLVNSKYKEQEAEQEYKTPVSCCSSRSQLPAVGCLISSLASARGLALLVVALLSQLL